MKLYTTSTDDAGGGTEVTGGSYAAQTIAFTSTGTGEISNSATITFANMPACTVLDFAVYSGTDLIVHGPLTTPRILSSGDSLIFGAGSVVVQWH